MASGKAAGKAGEKYTGANNPWGDPDKMKAYNEKKAAELSKEAKPLYQRDCQFCGTPLHIAVSSSAAGKRVALDLTAQVYAIVYEQSQAQTSTVVVRTELAYVNHYYTCPHTAPSLKKAE